MRIKQTVCFPIFPVEEPQLGGFFREISKIGFAGVEMWARDWLSDYEDVLDQARSAGLDCVSMIGHATLDNGLCSKENHERIEAELRESIDLAATHGMTGLICFSGNRVPGQSDLESARTCAEGFRRIAPYAEERGVNLNLELLNSRFDHLGYQCDHTDWGVTVCELVGSPRVKLLYDIYHMQIMEGDVTRSIRSHVGLIGHIHTAGNPGRSDLDGDQELNYAGIAKAIAASGYNLYVGHEYKPKDDPVESLQKAFAICDQG